MVPMMFRLPTVGFLGAYGLLFPWAVFRIAVSLLWMKQVCVSIMNFLLGRGWESPSVQMVYHFPLYWAESDFFIASPTFICMNAASLADEIRASSPEVRFGDVSNKKIPGNEEEEEEEPQCSVCLCDFAADDKVRQTPRCSHVFHKDCLDRWTAQYQTTCPLCRSSLSPQWIEQEETRTTTQRLPILSSSSRFLTTGFSHIADQVERLALQRDAEDRAISTPVVSAVESPVVNTD